MWGKAVFGADSPAAGERVGSVSECFMIKIYTNASANIRNHAEPLMYGVFYWFKNYCSEEMFYDVCTCLSI